MATTPPDPDQINMITEVSKHTGFFITEWGKQIITGLVVILLAGLKLLGQKSKDQANNDNQPPSSCDSCPLQPDLKRYAKHEDIKESERSIIKRFDRLEDKIETRFNNLATGLHHRIDDIFKQHHGS